jgi:hypothetical protein
MNYRIGTSSSQCWVYLERLSQKRFELLRVHGTLQPKVHIWLMRSRRYHLRDQKGPPLYLSFGTAGHTCIRSRFRSRGIIVTLCMHSLHLQCRPQAACRAVPGDSLHVPNNKARQGKVVNRYRGIRIFLLTLMRVSLYFYLFREPPHFYSILNRNSVPLFCYQK